MLSDYECPADDVREGAGPAGPEGRAAGASPPWTQASSRRPRRPRPQAEPGGHATARSAGAPNTLANRKFIKDEFRAAEEGQAENAAVCEGERAYPEMALSLELSNLDAGALEIDAESVVAPNANRSTKRYRAHVDHTFQDAVDKGIVAFLTAMAQDRAFGGVKPREFTDAVNPGPNSWYYKSGPDNDFVNKRLVKDRFRTAANTAGGDHEWVPCRLLIAIVADGQANDAARAGEWVSLANNLRARTSDLVFAPQRHSAVEDALADRAEEADGNHGWMQTTLREDGASVGSFGLTGHVGALYLEVGGDRTAKTGRSDTFHDDLTALWAPEKDPKSYGKEVAAWVKEGSGGPARLWNGDPEALVSASFLEPVDYSDDLDSHYTDSQGSSWGDTLFVFANSCAAKFDLVQEQLRSGKA